MLFIVGPGSLVLFLLWILTKKIVFGKLLLVGWTGIILLVLLAALLRPLTTKIVLEKDDYYGAYIIDTTYFNKEQAKWQYDHFRFEITPNDSIFFNVTNMYIIFRNYRVKIETTTNYNSARLIIKMEQPTHHIVSSNPTTYRDIWDFHLVFQSPYYHNMIFKKGKWKTH